MQAQHNDFVQINNQRFSIEQFLDIIEAQQKYLKKTEAVSPDDDKEEEDDDNFGLVEVDEHKEACIQSVLNNFDFESFVKFHNSSGEEINIDTAMDEAYQIVSESYDCWVSASEPDDDEVYANRKLFECWIKENGEIQLSATIVAVAVGKLVAQKNICIKYV